MLIVFLFLDENVCCVFISTSPEFSLRNKKNIMWIPNFVFVAMVQSVELFFFYRYTNKTVGGQTTVYAIVLKWPTGNTLTLGSPFPSAQTTTVSLVGYDSGVKFSWKPSGTQGMVITVPAIVENMLPCKWAWVFKLEGLLHKERNPAHPIYFPKFDMYKPRHNHYQPMVTIN